ncbi:MAG: gamma-glutamyl-gamma-aminobutyrate hydrolase family protein, partial [Terriglobales bacterium]
MEPLRIGLSARLLYPDPKRIFLPTKTVQYLEQSAANWVMSGGVLAFMIPEMSLASPHLPKGVAVKDFVDVLDGLLLQGGADVAPETYGETPLNPAWSGDRIRDRYEIELFEEFVRQGKPVFGICRGCQMINVALGGTLYQDLATQLPESGEHRNEAKYEHNFHDMRVLPETWLSTLYPNVTLTRINTIHHQAVKTLGEGLVVEAKSEPDAVVDALRWEGHSFVVGVQWHPEFMDPSDAALLDGKPLLDAFLAACEKR